MKKIKSNEMKKKKNPGAIEFFPNDYEKNIETKKSWNASMTEKEINKRRHQEYGHPLEHLAYDLYFELSNNFFLISYI